MAKHKPAKMLAVLGRCHRTGRWRIATRSSVLAVLGACRLDMRASFVEDDQDQMKMKVIVVLGSAVFILPEGAEVRPSGMSLLGGSLVDVPEHEQRSGLPTLDIEWTCILGRLQIVTGPVLDEITAASEAAKAAKREARKSKRKKGRKSKKVAAASPLLVDLSEPAIPVPVGHEPEIGVIGAWSVGDETIGGAPVGTGHGTVEVAADEDPDIQGWPGGDDSGGFADVGFADAAFGDTPGLIGEAVPVEVPVDAGDGVGVGVSGDVVEGSGELVGEAWRSHDWGDGDDDAIGNAADTEPARRSTDAAQPAETRA